VSKINNLSLISLSVLLVTYILDNSCFFTISFYHLSDNKKTFRTSFVGQVRKVLSLCSSLQEVKAILFNLSAYSTPFDIVLKSNSNNNADNVVRNVHNYLLFIGYFLFSVTKVRFYLYSANIL